MRCAAPLWSVSVARSIDCRWLVAIALFAAMASRPAASDNGAALIARGDYVTTMMGCKDCHTPGLLRGVGRLARATIDSVRKQPRTTNKPPSGFRRGSTGSPRAAPLASPLAARSTCRGLRRDIDHKDWRDSGDSSRRPRCAPRSPSRPGGDTSLDVAVTVPPSWLPDCRCRGSARRACRCGAPARRAAPARRRRASRSSTIRCETGRLR